VRTLATGENVIRDPNVREYYEVVRRLTRDPVFDRDRLVTLVRFQLGAYDHLLE
jgi:arabinofuranosyltransferase